MDESLSSRVRRSLSCALSGAASLATCAAAAGCAVPLSGTNDGAFDYVAAPEPSATPAADVRAVAERVKARLSAARIAADVTAVDDRTVRVVTDLGAARSVDAVVLWRGGLDAYPADDPAASLDSSHRTFAERLPDGRTRTRVVGAPIWSGLEVGPDAILSIASAEHGRALALRLGDAPRAALEAASRHSKALAFACGTTLLATTPLSEAIKSPLVLHLGDDIGAFARAADTRRLLESPLLPALRRVSIAALPVRWGIAAASALVPLVVSLAWLLFVRRFDRARPEPWWLVLSTFALGGVAVIPALAFQLACAATTPWLDPSLVTLGGQAWSLPIALPVYALVVGFSEEVSKFGATRWLAGRRPEFDEPVDGIVYACAAALGFAAVENVKYFALGRMSGALIAVRSFMTVPAHMFFSAIWGFALGRSLVSRRSRVAPFLAVSAVVHGTFDALVSIESTESVAALLVLPLGLAFFTLLRLALRHGVVRRRLGAAAPFTERLPASDLERSYFRVGSAASFWTCAAAMIATACALMFVGTTYEGVHGRIGAPFVAASTFLLALLGLTGYGAAATMPLDVAVDAQGLTFAGAMQPWGAIFGVDIRGSRGRAYVVVRSARGDLRLGPTRAATARAIERVIRDTLALSRDSRSRSRY